MFKILRFSFLFSVMMLTLSVVAAGNFNLHQMADQASRPTVLEVYEALGGIWPHKNPVPFQSINPEIRFTAGGRIRIPSTEAAMNRFLMEYLPQAIARLESLFPNATWALLGRDSVLLADALEAYYLSIGQKNRVVRIDMSTESFDTPVGLIAEYLDSLGAPINPQKASASKPWIVVDRTSFGGISWHVSGARKVVQIIYDNFIANGGDPAEFPSSVNAISLHPGNGDDFNGPHLIPFIETSRESYLASLKSGFPEKIVGIGSPISDGIEWHNTFGQLVKEKDGQVKSVPGYAFHLIHREQIIWEIINSGKLTSSAEFHALVDAEFLKLGLPLVSHLRNCSEVLDDGVLLKRRKEN